jgi:hypothetical protein
LHFYLLGGDRRRPAGVGVMGGSLYVEAGST